MGEFPADCRVIPRYPLLLLWAPGSTHGSWRWSGRDCRGSATALARSAPSAWLGAECCSCCWLYGLAFLGSAGVTRSILALTAFPWCCSGCEGGGGKSVTVLQIMVNQKSTLCEKSLVSHTVILLFGHRQGQCFSFGSCGLNYCCLLPFSRED